MQNRSTKGFTLIELSTTLVIIGLIVSGIVIGKTMLTSSRLQTVMTDADSYITAIGNFKQRYQALPGDMNNATSNWGTDSNGCNNGGGSTGTCNGNGDGQIGGATGSGTEYEVFRFWQHLYYAGMYSQRLNGVASSGTSYIASAGKDVPAGSIQGSGFSPVWEGTAASNDANYFPGYYGNVMIFGSTGGSFMTSSPIITTDQAASIDSKLDDGMPGTGNVRSFINTSSYTPGCATTNLSTTATYSTAVTGNLCSLIFNTNY